MGFRSRKTIKREFVESRAPQTDEDFLTGCGLANTDSSSNALKVRMALAKLGGVEASQVRAEDSFDHDLANFDFWGSLDSIALVLELENSLRVRFSDDTATQIPDPEGTPGYTVAEFVRGVLGVIGTRPRNDF